MLHFLYDMYLKDTDTKNSLKNFKHRLRTDYHYIPVISTHQEKLEYLAGLNTFIKFLNTNIAMYENSLLKMQNRIFGFESQLFVKCNRTGMSTLEKDSNLTLDNILRVRSQLELVQAASDGWLRQEQFKPEKQVLDISFKDSAGKPLWSFNTAVPTPFKFNVDVSKI